MPNLPKEAREQLRKYISKTSDDSINFFINLTGRYIDRRKKAELKKNAQAKVGKKMEDMMSEIYERGLDLKNKYQQKKSEAGSLKEEFYLITDTLFESSGMDVPKDVHAMDYIFQFLAELKDFRFNFRYLKKTHYMAYLQSIEKLIARLEREHKISEAQKVLHDFKSSRDFCPLLQATFQRIIKHYEFLARNFRRIRKKQLDKYLEIYTELSGVYEKFVSLIVVLILRSQTNNGQDYSSVRKRGLFRNLSYIDKSDWKLLGSGFNRNIRNALAHKTYNVDVVKEIVEFTDRDKTTTLAFHEIQKQTRELSALVLILPHVLISIFCAVGLTFKELLSSLPNRTKE